MTRTAICPACGGPQNADQEMCPDCGATMSLRDRYRLEAVLARRGGATTYTAHECDSGNAVVVKELALRSTESVKELELFEREAALLETLEHPAIPGFLEHFEVQRQKTLSLYVVQQKIDGTPLTHGPRRTPQQIAKIVSELLGVLDYLRSVDPPVVHRDIKPANILQRPDGSLALVDFGAATVVEALYSAGSTMTGTFGYMAPEQMIGNAEPATDVYGLGATALRLMTGREPQELWSDGVRFDYDRTEFDKGLVGLIDSLTEPATGDRPHDLAKLRAELDRFADGDAGALRTYEGSLVQVAGTGTLPRPSTRAAWAIVATNTALSAAIVAGLVWGFVDIQAQFIAIYAVAIGLGLPLLKRFVGRTSRNLSIVHVLRKHPGVRGIVTSRRVEPPRKREILPDDLRPRFVLSCRFHHNGQAIEADSEVSKALFNAVELGMEVAVWYHPRRLESVVITAVPDARGRRLLL